jgi:hypothetical protein
LGYPAYRELALSVCEQADPSAVTRQLVIDKAP